MILPENQNTYEQICNQYLKTNPNITGIGIGKKIKNGERLDQLSIIFSVQEKKPLSELSEEEIIPQNININNQNIISDVVRCGRAIRVGCKDWVQGQKIIDGYGTGTNATAEQNLHRVSVRPLVGGISITEQSGLSEYLGTLGCLAIDNEDGKVVGLTNSHVVCECYVEPEDQLSIYSFNSSGDPIIQPALYEPYNGSVTSLPSNQLINKIGTVKRYASSNFNNIYFDSIPNYIDAAVISIDAGKATSASFGMLGFNETGPLPFATTSEINSLISNDCPLAISSRTTGAKNVDCGIIATEINSSAYIAAERCLPYDNDYIQQLIPWLGGDFDFWRGGQRKYIYYNDLVKFEYADGSDGVSVGGDSGSAVIALLPGGVRKIVGLLFLGTTDAGATAGWFCRIDRVAQTLNVSQWNGNLNFSNPSTWQYITKPVVLPDPENDLIDLPLTITEGGKKYWRIGTTSQSITGSVTTTTLTPTTTTLRPTTTTLRPTTTTTTTTTATLPPPPILSNFSWGQRETHSFHWDVATIPYTKTVSPDSVKVEYFNTYNNQWTPFKESVTGCEPGTYKNTPTSPCSYNRNWTSYKWFPNDNAIQIFKFNKLRRIVPPVTVPDPREAGISRIFRISFGYSGVYGTPSEITITT
jgi:hypothetical protein